uniref:protein DEK isoform X2 n=1 Tax=Scatophagus argus TaxID=75038 RepID=UPI001ED82482|nr:protein DEK isoform X2 [Scatophagus argus]
MSDVAEEAMDSSAVSDEEVANQKETSQEDQSSPDKSRSKISAGDIVEGKRTKKTVERLDFQAPKQKEKLKIGDGSGEKLGDIPRIGYQVTKMKPADLKPLHAILFDRPGKMATIKKNLRLFNGFPFDADSEQYTKKREKLLKNSNFTNTKLKVVCSVLDLEKKGTHSDLVDRILTFLIAPKNSGKRLPVKKKKKSKKKLSGDDSTAKTKKSKPKPRSSSSSPKKSKSGSKSKAIVMDSSSDEDDDEEDEKAAASAEAEGSDAEDKPSEKDEEQSDKSEESADEEEEDGDGDESPKSKSDRAKSKKSAAVKRQRTPAKKTGPPKKRPKKEASDKSEADADSEDDEKPRKKKSAPAKPAAKTKKADSSSNSKTNTNTAEDSSDDDEPLIKMVKRAPTDEQLKETVKSLLKEANLEEMTMKQICQRVFDTYPDHDLSGKKDYIKQTVKSLIT